MASVSKNMSASEAFEKRLREIYQNEVNSSGNTGFDGPLFRNNVRFKSACLGPPARVTYSAIISSEMCNKLGQLHGGCSTTLIDVASSTLLLGLGQEGSFSLGGISRSLNIKFLRPAFEDMEILINCELTHSGKKLALLKCDIRRVDTGEILVVGEHDKVNTDPPPTSKL